MRKHDIYIPKPVIGGLLLVLVGGVLLSSSGYVQALVGLGQSRMNGPVGGSHAVRQPAASVAPGNLVTHYPLDGDAKDAAATSGNTLTDNNTVTQASTKTNAAQLTSASSEYLSITDNAALSTGDIDFSIAAWVYPTTTTGTQSIASKYGATGSGTSEYIVRRTGTAFTFLVSGGSTTGNIVSTVTVSANKWYYVVAWHDAANNTINIQVNNSTVNSDGHTVGSNDSGTDFNMGRRGNGSEYFDGRIDAFGFWKRTLTSAERTQMYNGGKGRTYQQLPSGLTTDLIAYWELNELSGTRNDSASTNHLTDNNTVTNNPGLTGIATGNAAQFTSSNSEYLSKADNADLSTGDIDFTIATWFNPDTLSGTQTIIGKYAATGSTTAEYLLRRVDSTFTFLAVGSSLSAGGPTSSVAPVVGQWFYIVAWHDSVADTLNIQVNGTVTSTSYTLGVNDSATSFEMGRRGNGTEYLDGRVDEPGMWKRVLTADERTALYNEGYGRMYRDLSAPLKANLVSYWDMDEDSGDRADAHYHGVYHGTASGTPTVTQGKFGKAYSFDGTDDYIQASTIPTLSGDMSVSFWFNGGTNTSKRIVNFTNSGGAGLNLHYTSSGGGSITVDNSGGVSSNITASTIVSGVWHHVVVTRSGTTYTLYVDNVSIGTSGGSATSYNGLFLAKIYSSASYYTGLLDDVRIYDTALTTGQISDLYGGSKAPACDQTCVGWWKMDETSGQTITDSSGTGNTGTLGADSSVASDDPTLNAPGIYSGSVTLDATDDLINVPDSNSLDFGTGNFSTTGWFKGSGATDYRALLYHFTVGSPGFFIYSNTTTGYLVAGIGSSTVDITSTTNIRDGSWHHVVMVRNGATLTLYVDGISVGSVGGLSARSASSTSALMIGRNSSSNLYNWSGEIDDVRIYNRALEPYEIAEQYTAGR